MTNTIGVAITTLQAKHHLPKCLPPWLQSSLKPKVLVIDSSSTDGTVEFAHKMGAETLTIPRRDFNHGLTREKARKKLGTDIVVMVTQDAYAVDNTILEKLVQPIVSKKASVSYARQLPHVDANFFEAFPREFNYPAESHIRSSKDKDQYGVYTIFCSDSCCAYLNSALDEVGGFPEVLTGEDTVVVSKLLRRGHSISYTAEAAVYHSHDYTLMEEFKRYFDTGLARQQYKEWVEWAGKDSKRGKDFLHQMMSRLLKEKPSYIPYALVQTGMKWMGYRLGSVSVNAPLWWKKALSGQSFYWQSNPFLEKSRLNP